MSPERDIRWIQRFSSFSRALNLLQDPLKEGPSTLSLLEKEGVVRRFKYSLELAWKTVKDYLEASGNIISPITPRQVIKDGVDAKIIEDGQVWMDMIDHRNLLSHTYDSAVFEAAVEAIAGRYLSAMDRLQNFLREKSQT